MSQVGRKIIANKVKYLREQKNMKREELSLALNCDNSYISKLEKCRVNIPIDRLEDIANFFGIEIKEFFLS